MIRYPANFEEIKACGHNWIYDVSQADGYKTCSKCGCWSYTPFGKPLYQIWREGRDEYLESIKNDPWKKKLYNYIKNDLQGIINGFNDDRISLTYNERFLKDEFLDKILDCFKSVNFKEQIYDKKILKSNLVELFQTLIDEDNFLIGRKREMTNISVFNEYEQSLFSYIIENYDKNNT